MLATEYGETDADSAVIAKMVAKGLSSRGHISQIVPIEEKQIGKISQIRADCIFNLIEWCGRDIGLASEAFGEMRKLGIPVTGSSEEMYVLTGDKIQVKQELQKMGAPAPQAAVFESGVEPIPKLNYPVIVKPSLEHCSTGLTYDSIAKNDKQLRQIVERQIKTFGQPVLAEEFIVGRELLAYLLEDKEQIRVLPVEEMLFEGKGEFHFQTYDTKWNPESRDYNMTDVDLAKLSQKEKKIIEDECIRVFRALGLRGYARFDIRLRGGIPYLLETNANPSVFDGEDELESVDDEVIWGIKFSDYLEIIVQTAVYHHGRGWRV